MELGHGHPGPRPAPSPDILPGGEFIAHKVLEDDPHFAAQVRRVILPQVNPIEQDAASAWVVEAQQQLDHGGLSCPVLPHQRQALTRMQP